MLFNSIDFAVFLPITFLLYWHVANKSIKFQNAFLLLTSYIFYGWWDWRFLSLILLSTITDYYIGWSLHRTKKKLYRKLLLFASLLVNIGFLGFFKYYNFFLDNFEAAFSLFGTKFNISSLSVILPVGISFYTFQTLSYSIDLYRNRLAPTKDFVAFAAFVSFFPQLVAGPIERASNFLPQFSKKRIFDYHQAVDGLRQMLWGLFKKVVIADNCAIYVDTIFSNSNEYSGSTLLLGTVLFSFQIYGDFSGYSDIAIGTSKLFSFNLKRNFAYPYFSRDIAEFWRRWHISLSTWFRDYLYIPLGGGQGGTWTKIRNTFIIFVVSGFWHGANWTFVAWGALNALYFLPLLLTNKNRKNLDTIATGKIWPSLKELSAVVLTFGMTSIAWIFFRAKNIDQAFNYISRMVTPELFRIPEVFPSIIVCFIFLQISIEWLQKERAHGLDFTNIQLPIAFRWSAYLSVALLCAMYLGKQNSFIYFQF